MQILIGGYMRILHAENTNSSVYSAKQIYLWILTIIVVTWAMTVIIDIQLRGERSLNLSVTYKSFRRNLQQWLVCDTFNVKDLTYCCSAWTTTLCTKCQQHCVRTMSKSCRYSTTLMISILSMRSPAMLLSVLLLLVAFRCNVHCSSRQFLSHRSRMLQLDFVQMPSKHHRMLMHRA